MVARDEPQPSRAQDQGKHGGVELPDISVAVVTMASWKDVPGLVDLDRRARAFRERYGSAPLQPRPARALTESELEIWRSLDGAMNPDGQRASDAELARQRQQAENSPAARRIRQSWSERNLGEDWRR